MKQKNKKALPLIIPILTLILVSLACDFPVDGISETRDLIQDALSEDCYEIDRSTYETLSAKLGQTPETPKYPETAVYEACKRKKFLGFDFYGDDDGVFNGRFHKRSCRLIHPAAHQRRP